MPTTWSSSCKGPPAVRASMQLSGPLYSCQGLYTDVRASMQLSGPLCSCQGLYAAVRASIQLSGPLYRCQGLYAAVRASMQLSGPLYSCQGLYTAVRASTQLSGPLYSCQGLYAVVRASRQLPGPLCSFQYRFVYPEKMPLQLKSRLFMAEKQAFQLKSHLFSVHNLISDRIQTFINEIAEFGTKWWQQSAIAAVVFFSYRCLLLNNLLGSIPPPSAPPPPQLNLASLFLVISVFSFLLILVASIKSFSPPKLSCKQTKIFSMHNINNVFLPSVRNVRTCSTGEDQGIHSLPLILGSERLCRKHIFKKS